MFVISVAIAEVIVFTFGGETFPEGRKETKSSVEHCAG